MCRNRLVCACDFDANLLTHFERLCAVWVVSAIRLLTYTFCHSISGETIPLAETQTRPGFLR